MTTEVIVWVPADADYKARVSFHDWNEDDKTWTEDKKSRYEIKAGGEKAFHIWGTRGLSVDEIDHE